MDIMEHNKLAARPRGFLSRVFGGEKFGEFALNVRRMFWVPPIDDKEILRDIARTKSSGNVRLRMGDVVFPDERKRFIEEARKLPPVSKQIEEHFDLETGAPRE